jgi:hypothetical protein
MPVRIQSRLAAVGDGAVSSLGSIRGMTAYVIACFALDVQLRSLVRPTSATNTPPLLFQDAAPQLLNGTSDNISFDPILGIPIIAGSRTVQSSPLVPHNNAEEDDDNDREQAAAEPERREVNGT